MIFSWSGNDSLRIAPPPPAPVQDDTATDSDELAQLLDSVEGADSQADTSDDTSDDGDDQDTEDGADTDDEVADDDAAADSADAEDSSVDEEGEGEVESTRRSRGIPRRVRKRRR